MYVICIYICSMYTNILHTGRVSHVGNYTYCMYRIMCLMMIDLPETITMLAVQDAPEPNIKALQSVHALNILVVQGFDSVGGGRANI